MINLFFFFMPEHFKISDVFHIKQGKNILNKSRNSEIQTSSEDSFLLTLNSIDFDYQFIDETKLLRFNDYSDKTDRKYLLQSSDILINRVGTTCKTISMYNDFQDKKIVISQNFIFLRPKEIVSDVPLSYLHFLIQICVDQLLKIKNGKDAKQQYLTVKDIEDFKIPTTLLKIDVENEAIYKKFENLNNDLNNSYSKIINTINLLNEKKTKLEKFKKKHFESAIGLANNVDE